MEGARPKARWIRRVWPWLAGVAILVVIATRIDPDAFRTAIRHGPHLTLATIDLGVTIATLGTDAVSTWIGLVAVRMRRPLGKILAVRGATFLLFLVNYAVGQGGFGYYLYRTGASALRAAGATLFLMGTNLATLLVLTALAFAIHPVGPESNAMWWTLLASCIAFVAYLGVIGFAPTVVARREMLAPLFDAGLRGHALAMFGRLPHVVVIVVGIWVAMRAWGIAVPFGVGVTLMPAVVIASVLPIAPAGLGTTQAALVYFFGAYAPGATDDDRNAAILAFAIVHFVYTVLAQLVVGLASTPFARRADPTLPKAP